MFAKTLRKTLPVALAALTVVGFTAAAHAPTSLKNAYKKDFFIGVAINGQQISGQDVKGDAIIAEQFSSISPENALKWSLLHPQLDKYTWDAADKYVEFGEKNHMFIVGHNLVWHSQVPGWVFRDDKGNLLTRDALLERMHDHIRTVVGRYKGRIQSWDVVNEALNEDGTLRQSLWLKIIGPDFIEKAFQYAHEADPQAQLTYNDYNLENEPKRNGAIALIKKMQADGIPINCVGIQGHDHMDWPTEEQEDSTIAAFAALGLKVSISELDIDVLPSAGPITADVSANLQNQQTANRNPYVNGLPDSVQKDLAARYTMLFHVYMKHRKEMSRVTFWGLSDGDSWLNGFPVRGRTNYPLLYDRQLQTKPAYDAVIEAAKYKAK